MPRKSSRRRISSCGRIRPVRAGDELCRLGRKVAFHQVLAWQKRRGRDRLRFTPEFMEAVAGDAAAATDRLEERGRLLDGCIRKLPDGQRELLRLRYIENCSIDEVAQSR